MSTDVFLNDKQPTNKNVKDVKTYGIYILVYNIFRHNLYEKT